MSAKPALRASLWAYPWDLLDEGPRVALEHARAEAGVDALNVAATYHAGLFLLPHNPRRRLYTAEDGVVYFRAAPECFAGAPAPTLSSLTHRSDPLATALRAARRAGLGLRAWVVACHNSRLGVAEPGLSVVNALGDRLPFALCPLKPRVQRYVRGLIRALRAYPGLDGIDLEALYWLPAEHAWHHAKFGARLDGAASLLLGLCCCGDCARASDVDRSTLVRAVREPLRAALAGAALGPATRDGIVALAPEAGLLLEARQGALARLLEDLVQEAHAPVRALVGSGLIGRSWTLGVDVERWARVAPAVIVNAYSADPVRVRADLTAFRSTAPDAHLVVGLNATEPVTSSAASLAAQSVAAIESRPDELSYYHYGLLPLPRLGWVRSAVDAARAALDEAAPLC